MIQHGESREIVTGDLSMDTSFPERPVEVRVPELDNSRFAGVAIPDDAKRTNSVYAILASDSIEGGSVLVVHVWGASDDVLKDERLPGGVLLEGESAKDGLQRMLNSQLGLDVEEVVPFGPDLVVEKDGVFDSGRAYVVRSSGHPHAVKSGDEHEVSGFRLIEGDRPQAESLRSGDFDSCSRGALWVKAALVHADKIVLKPPVDETKEEAKNGDGAESEVDSSESKWSLASLFGFQKKS